MTSERVNKYKHLPSSSSALASLYLLLESGPKNACAKPHVLAWSTASKTSPLGPKVCNVFLIYYLNILIIVLV